MAAVPHYLFSYDTLFETSNFLNLLFSDAARRPLVYGAAAIPREVTDNALLMARAAEYNPHKMDMIALSTGKIALKAWI